MQGARVEWSAVAWRVGIVAGCRLSVAGWVVAVVCGGASGKMRGFFAPLRITTEEGEGSSVRGARGPWISSRTISSTRGSGVGADSGDWLAALAAAVSHISGARPFDKLRAG